MGKNPIKNNGVLVFLNDAMKAFYYKNFISDKKLINKNFKKRLGREVDLDEPIKYNDKLQWLKLYWNDPLATKCADKYLVRDYIKKTIGKDYLNELLAVYESVDEIALDQLPESFVLKGTHGSGYNIICKDKNKMNWKQEFKKMKRWLRTNYYLSKREWVYKDIKPRIICEKYMEDEYGRPPNDYKFFCFNGEPKMIQVDIDRFGKHNQNFYTPEWKYMNIEIEKASDSTVQVEPPKNLKLMLELSKKLTSSFPHARADFYEHNGKVIFGEITFFHHSGMGKFNPPEFEEKMGNYITLPKKNKEIK